MDLSLEALRSVRHERHLECSCLLLLILIVTALARHPQSSAHTAHYTDRSNSHISAAEAAGRGTSTSRGTTDFSTARGGGHNERVHTPALVITAGEVYHHLLIVIGVVAQELLRLCVESMQVRTLLEHSNWVIGVVLQTRVLVLRRIAEHEVCFVARAAVEPLGERGDSSEADAGENAAGEGSTRSVETAGFEEVRFSILIRAHPLARVGVSGGSGTALQV